MTSDDKSPMGEFEFIEQILKPLTHGHAAARGLADDAAMLGNFVITKDILVAGVHFFADDPFDIVARKALRVNLSDVAAKGAKPLGYFLGIAWPSSVTAQEQKLFAEGLAQDGLLFDIALLGGDTVKSQPGAPMTISITMVGEKSARTPDRASAKPGDLVFVTGTIGDAGLGLALRRAQQSTQSDAEKALLARYLLPQPRLTVAPLLTGFATASLDISDGLLADLGHITRQSEVALSVYADAIPLSQPAQQWLDNQPDKVKAIAALASAGDDYEIAFTVRPEDAEALIAQASALDFPLTQIGKCETSTTHIVSLLDKAGNPIAIDKSGYRHF